MTDAVCIAHGGDLGEPSGGTDRVAAFASGLAARGYDVTVVAPTPDGPLTSAFDSARFVGVDVASSGLATQPIRAVRVLRAAKRAAADRDARLQVVHATLAGVAALLGSRGYVLDMHDLARRSPLYGELPAGRLVQRLVGGLEGLGLRRAGDVVVVSEGMRDAVLAHWPVAPRRVTVIPNGYDPRRVEPYADVGTVPGRVAFLGTLHPKLDVDALCTVAELEAVDELVVIGDGERRAALEARASELPALDVRGRLPDDEAFPLVASAAVAVNPQRPSELQAVSSPVKLYYYAALGLAIVTTSGPAPAEELAAADGAIAVDPGGDVAGAVAALLADPERRRRLGAAAANAVRSARWEDRATALAAIHGGSTDA